MVRKSVNYEDYLRSFFRSMGCLILEIGSFCPVECRHCHVMSDRSTRSNLKIDELTGAIESFARLESSSFISITGGEPFWYRDALEHSLKTAKRCNLFTFVLTSGHWATSETAAEKVLSGLWNYIDLIGFSVDKYHLEKQPIDRTIIGIKEAQKRSLGVFVALGSMGFDDPIRPYVKNILTENSLEGTDTVNYPLLSRGKGEWLPELSGRELSNPANTGCLAVGSPVVTSTGHICACCHTQAANETRVGKGGFLEIGNVNDSHNAWSNYWNDERMRILRGEGPLALAKMLSVEVPRGAEHWDICKVCDLVRSAPESSGILS